MKSPNPQPFGSATALGHAIRRGKLKARDALEAQIERIQKYDQAVNAVVVRDFDEARREAERMDRIVQ
ncbi:MAG: hypothetical protein EBW84_06045, partial [Betaproteobacteria bacterium]|nr:hypothetical protein [Betaproteobacteria bacterium]